MAYTFYFLIGLTGALLITIIVLGTTTYSLSKRIKRLTAGTNGKNLEESIYQLMDDHMIFQNRIERVEETNARIGSEVKNSMRGIATVRFNAFADVGGKQSFATAMVSEEGTGVIISSIYTRDRMNVYAKPIVDFSSEYELSAEESRALKEASKIFI
jgi:hypothetical protein